MKNIRYDQSENADQQWSEYLKRSRDEDIYGHEYRNPDEVPSSASYEGEQERERPLSGFRREDQGVEDITNYGRVNPSAQGTSSSRRYSSDMRTRDDGTGDWWQEERSSPPDYSSNQERSQRQGLHRGKGPKNYRRSDERIREDVNDFLSEDSYLDASEIEVSVMDCEVTLTGKVDSREAKRRAEDISESVSGVKNVENRLRVERSIPATD